MSGRRGSDDRAGYDSSVLPVTSRTALLVFDAILPVLVLNYLKDEALLNVQNDTQSKGEKEERTGKAIQRSSRTQETEVSPAL